MKELSLPTVKQIETYDTTATYAIEPVEPGYSHTLGPPLCRALLSLPGLAVTGVHIQGWRPGVVRLPGMHESVADLLLNCKRVRLRRMPMSKDRPASLLLKAQGTLPLSARDLVVPSGIEIVTPNVHLATLIVEDACLSLELLVERGKGYVPADARAEPPAGVIAVDAVYTPVQQASYRVEQTRVGPLVNYEKLLLTITTDGRMSPKEAMRQSADVLVRSYTRFATIDAGVSPSQPVRSGVPIPPDIDNLPLVALDLPLRTHNSLKRSGITRVGQLLCLSEANLREIRNFGEQAFTHLVARMVALNLLPVTSEPVEHDDPSKEEARVNVDGSRSARSS